VTVPFSDPLEGDPMEIQSTVADALQAQDGFDALTWADALPPAEVKRWFLSESGSCEPILKYEGFWVTSQDCLIILPCRG